VLTPTEYDFWKKKAYFVARQTVPTHTTEDMVAVGLASLVTSLRTYDKVSKLSLSNHILNHMRWAMLDAARNLLPGSRKDSARGIFYTEVPLDEHRPHRPHRPSPSHQEATEEEKTSHTRLSQIRRRGTGGGGDRRVHGLWAKPALESGESAAEAARRTLKSPNEQHKIIS
jgi:hypothetical protein